MKTPAVDMLPKKRAFAEALERLIQKHAHAGCPLDAITRVLDGKRTEVIEEMERAAHAPKESAGA